MRTTFINWGGIPTPPDTDVETILTDMYFYPSEPVLPNALPLSSRSPAKAKQGTYQPFPRLRARPFKKP